MIDWTIRVFYFRFLWVVRLWYGITRTVTRKRGVAFPEIHSEEEIPVMLSWGQQYKPDPLKGFFDVLSHPTKVQDNINHGRPVGDCDDHGIYWVTMLLRNGLVAPGNVWFSTFFYRDPKKRFGHVVAVWRDTHGIWWWADYGKPRIVESQWAWAYYGAKRRNAELLAAGMFPVRLDRRGNPRFGKAESYVPKK